MKKIEVLAPIRWISVRRNEVGKVVAPTSTGIFIENERQQRAGLFLRDVKYRFHAEFVFIPPGQRGKIMNPSPEYLSDAEEYAEFQKQSEEQKKDVRPDETEAKYAAMFQRRAKKGQTFHHPYLGCREFAAAFRLVPSEEMPPDVPEELMGTRQLGWMLYDMDFTDPKDIKPLFFNPTMVDGTLAVPDRNNSEEVRG